MTRDAFEPGLRRYVALLLVALVGGCAALRPSVSPPPSYFSLDLSRTETPASDKSSAPMRTDAPALIISPPHAAPGFDSQRIIYVREAHKLEYYAHNEWIDTPARLLAPLIVATLQNSGSFSAVLQTPSAAVADLRLDTQILRLQHDFGSRPSRARFTLRAYIVESTTRRVLAWREFEAVIPAASDDPRGGVVAANRAVRRVLEQLADFCSDTARHWMRPDGDPGRR